MIEFKHYKELQELADKLGLPNDKETMRLYVKLVERFNEQLTKEVNELQAKNRTGRLQHGHVSVNRKELKEHLRVCKKVINGVDEAMRTPANIIRGSRIAKLMNELNNTLFISSHSFDLTSSIDGQSEYEDELIKAFSEVQDEFLLKAAFDGTKRRNLTFSISVDNSRGGFANYNKKESRFTYLWYVSNGYEKQIPI